eukprot:6198644-Pleurochrysis_carterae.AAC.2
MSVVPLTLAIVICIVESWMRSAEPRVASLLHRFDPFGEKAPSSTMPLGDESPSATVHFGDNPPSGFKRSSCECRLDEDDLCRCFLAFRHDEDEDDL